MKIRLRSVIQVVFCILLFVSLPLLFSVWKKSAGIQMNKENELMRRKKERLSDGNQLLDYELRRLSARGRIEATAGGLLGLRYPDHSVVAVIVKQE